MSKVFKLVILFFLFFSFIWYIKSSNIDDIDIISRAQWNAVESFRYLDSKQWQDKLSKASNITKKELNNTEKEIAKIEALKIKKANKYIISNYSSIFWIKKISKQENWHKLAWPISYSKKKIAIVVHHTALNVSPDADNYEIIRDIYKYHSLGRWWWDIGYNFVIGTKGEIFEWRAWWDYSVWAHDKWNNQTTIWIALIWNYDKNNASNLQINSLKKLTKYLVKKYDIDLSRKVPFFEWCEGVSLKCQKNPIIVNYMYPIAWHRDSWNTKCPWDKLHAQMQLMKRELWVGLSKKNQKLLDLFKDKLENFSERKLLDLLSRIELLIDKSSIKNKNLLFWIKDLILDIEKKRNVYTPFNEEKKSFDDNNSLKVKLSYPKDDYISIEVNKNLSLNFIKTPKEYIFDFKKTKKNSINSNLLNFSFTKNKLFIKNTEIIDFSKTKFLRIKVPKNEIIEIKSWERKPKWDKSWLLNDNKFRWDIVLYTKNDKLIVVNDILLNDYLKWLWEVSNSTNIEKVRTIIVLARTYARWYMTKARKFAWEWYDGSDDPNVFQKYLWFWLEKRSPNVNEIVEETKDLVVTYNWVLIKPWYFSSSNGATTSFFDFCKTAKWVPDCSYPKKFPFLAWVVDNWWIWKKRAWHWVWVAWTWVQYFSERWWNFFMIIKYFLDWVEIKKISK